MADFESVERALSEGASPAMLCSTCPWDRNCIVPPEMSKADVDAKLAEAQTEDAARLAEAKAKGEQGGMPMGTILTALSMGGRHQQAKVCPVFVVRLRSSNGREVVDGLKAQMRAWDDEAVS